MMIAALNALIDSPWAQVVGWTLFHSLWQITVVGLISVIVLRVVHKCTARIRYGIACLCLLLVAAAPLLTLSWLSASQFANDETKTTPTTIVVSTPDVPAAVPPTVFAENSDPFPTDKNIEATGLAVSTFSAAPTPVGFVSLIERWLPVFVAIWFFGVSLGFIRTAFGFQRVWQWKRRSRHIDDVAILDRFAKLSRQLGVRNAELKRSNLLNAPAVIGFLKPAILVPGSLLTTLTPAELDSILAHELAHIRRHDVAVNILQCIVETVFFFHPVVWWLSGRIRVERELCCDDSAVASCNNPALFATALAKLEAMRCAPNNLLIAANGNSVIHRIRRLTQGSDLQQRNSLPLIASSIILLLTCIGISAATSNVAKAARIPSNILEPTEQEAEETTPEKAKRPSMISEVVRTDSQTGLQQRVFADIKISAMSEKAKATSTKLPMKYSNVIGYSLIPAKVAKELNAIVVGEIDFGETKPEKDLTWDLPYLRAPEKAKPTSEEKAAEQLKQQWALAEVEYQSLRNTLGKNHPRIRELQQRMDALAKLLDKLPARPQRFVPDPNDPVWLPGHLSTYGMNPTGQKKFQIVAIQEVDLGIGPKFGPVVALVSNDANSEFGLFGRDWARQVCGENGEVLWALPDGRLHYVVGENAKYFRRQNKQTEASRQNKPPIPKLKILGSDQPIKEAFFSAFKKGRSATDMLKHLETVTQITGQPPADRTINMETILSATPRYWLGGGGTDADEVNLNLPEGSNTRAWFQGEKIEFVEKDNHVEILITNGKLRWLDPVGVTRVELFPDGGAEQLSVKAFIDADEIVMEAKSKWLDPNSTQEVPPVVVRLNTETGATKGEKDPPHGSIRYSIQHNKEKPLLRLKMKWYYDRKRLEEEAAEEKKKSKQG